MIKSYCICAAMTTALINRYKRREMVEIHSPIEKLCWLSGNLLCPIHQNPTIFSGMMELLWDGLHTQWHVDQSRTLPPCTSCLTPYLTVIMASSYPSPFEGTGEVKEGFLCPLCLKDLQSFYQLQDHYEEEHSGDDRHVRGQLKSESLLSVYCVRGLAAAWILCANEA